MSRFVLCVAATAMMLGATSSSNMSALNTRVGHDETLASGDLVRSEGKPARVDLVTLEALCDVFGVRPGELLEHEPKRPKKHRQRKAA